MQEKAHSSRQQLYPTSTSREDLNKESSFAVPQRKRSNVDKDLTLPLSVACTTGVPRPPPCWSSQSHPLPRGNSQHGGPSHSAVAADKSSCRVRTLTGKEIELDIEPDYKVRTSTTHKNPPSPAPTCWHVRRNTGLTDQGEGRRERRYPTGPAAPHLRREADV